MNTPPKGAGGAPLTLALASPRFYPMQSRASAGSSRFQHSRFRVPISFTCNDLVFNFDGFMADFSTPAETVNGYAYNIEGAVLVVNGANTAITFAGVQAGVVPDGGSLKSDPVTVATDLLPTDTVYIDFCHNVQSGGTRLGGLTVQAQNGEFVKSATSTLVGELGTIVAGATVTKRTAFGPTMVAARPIGAVKSVLIWGDSIAVGWEDAGPLVVRAQGWPARMLDSDIGGRVGVGNVSARGNGLAATSAGGAAGMARRVAALKGFASRPFSGMLCQLGINNINSATALVLDDVKQLYRDTWAYMRSQFPGVPIIQSTIAPLTTVGTTAWTDEAGQTFGNTNVGPSPSILSQINDWIMSNPPEIDGHIVTHTSIIGTDTAKWKTTGFAATLVNAVTAGQANPYRITAAPVVGTNLVFEPGGGANLDNHADFTVLSVADLGGGQFDVTLNRTVVKAHAAGVSVGSSIVADGVHNASYGHGLQADEGAVQKYLFDRYDVEWINPLLWLDASDEASLTLTDGKLSQVNDKSGNGYHATNATPANQPVPGLLNGRRAMRFDGAQYLLSSLPSQSAFWFFVACKHDAAQASAVVVGRRTNSSRRHFIGFGGTGGADGIVGAGAVFASPASMIGLFADAKANVLAGGADGTTRYAYVDGVAATDAAGAVTADNPLAIGAYNTGAVTPSLNSFLIGEIGEVIAFSSQPTTAQIKWIDAYLAHKWGV